jgi:5'-nucleotidase
MLAVLALALAAATAAAPVERTVTLLAFSDYHSHAVPFLSEGRPGQGGIARAIAFLRAERSRGDTLVISGGDMLNQGSPTWSDEQRCVEWPWLFGLVDMMALGNHDLDYGWPEFQRCRAQVDFPVLSANLLGAQGPILGSQGKPYVVREVAGVKLGFFAVAGADSQRLIKRENLPEGARWDDAVATARRTVEALRRDEKVDVVVEFGHQLREDDEALARAVPGIDLILGTHSHHRGELTTIPGTTTRLISPYQYLSYVSRVRLAFRGRALQGITGELVRMDETRPEDPQIAAQVARLQQEVRQRRPERFEVLGRTALLLSDAGVSDGESLIGNWATDTLRRASGVDVLLATASGFRASLPAGDVTVEDFYAAIPYRNRIATAQMSGEQLLGLLATSQAKAGSDGFSQLSGARYAVVGGRPDRVEVEQAGQFRPLDPKASYRVGTTDFQAYVAAGYKEAFAAALGLSKSEIDVHAVLIEALKQGPVSARLDGRIGR